MSKLPGSELTVEHRIACRAAPGANLYEVWGEACRIALSFRVDVELLFNDCVYLVEYRKLMEPVEKCGTTGG